MKKRTLRLKAKFGHGILTAVTFGMVGQMHNEARSFRTHMLRTARGCDLTTTSGVPYTVVKHTTPEEQAYYETHIGGGCVDSMGREVDTVDETPEAPWDLYIDSDASADPPGNEDFGRDGWKLEPFV